MNQVDPPIPVAKLHSRGVLWLRGFASTAGALAVLALVFLATKHTYVEHAQATKRDMTLDQAAELLRLRAEVTSLESSETGRQCMITVARGDYDDFLRELGWTHSGFLTGSGVLTGAGMPINVLTVDEHGRLAVKPSAVTVVHGGAGLTGEP